MRTWITTSIPGWQDNVVWVEMPDGHMLLLTEEGHIEKLGEYDSRIVKRLVQDNLTWEEIT